MLFPDQCYRLLNFGSGQRIEGVGRGDSAGDMLGDLLQAIENHCVGGRRIAIKSAV